MKYQLLQTLLAVLVLSLTPLAHASPPDQTWISGVYDNADYDDAVLAVVASVASLEFRPSHEPEFDGFVVGLVLPIDESLHPTPPRSWNHTRAPPAS